MYVTLSKISDNYTHATREKQFLMNIVVKKKKIPANVIQGIIMQTKLHGIG